MRKENQYLLIKDGKSFFIDTHKVKLKISLVNSNKAKKMISFTIIFVFVLRHN